MGDGLIQVYSGEGHGKSATALGRAIQTAGMGEDVVIINFLKGNQRSLKLRFSVLRRAPRNFHSFPRSVSRRKSTTSETA